MIVNTDALLRLFYTSLLAGVGATVIFAVAIYGSTRAADMRRTHRSSAAALYAGVAVLSLLVCAGAVVWGVVLVSQKS